MPYLAVSGNIGTGKTTLAKIIEDDLGFTCVTEQPQENKFLADFYFDMKRWAFHSQLSFMLTRVRALMSAQTNSSLAVLDRSVDEDFHIFVKALHEYGNLEDREFLLLSNLYDTLKVGLPNPSLYIYLHDEPSLIFKRILFRGFQYESKIEVDYIAKLDHLYEAWRKTIRAIPVVDIETSSLDFRQAPGREFIVQKIRDSISQLIK